MCFQHFGRTFIQRFPYILSLQRRQQNTCVAANDPQQCIIIFALFISSDRVKILPMFFIPQAKALPIKLLHFCFHFQETALGTFFHHVVETIRRTVRQARNKGILLGQHRKHLPRIRITCDILCHFDRKFVGKPHNRQKLLLRSGQRINHSSGKCSINIRMTTRQHTTLKKCMQIQIHS